MLTVKLKMLPRPSRRSRRRTKRGTEEVEKKKREHNTKDWPSEVKSVLVPLHRRPEKIKEATGRGGKKERRNGEKVH